MGEPRWLPGGSWTRFIPSFSWSMAAPLASGPEVTISSSRRPKNRLAYEPDSDLATLAAAYLFGLVKNHGYVDGNKRVAFATAATFLLLNGWRLTASETEAYDAVIEAADGRRAESDLADWLRANSEPVH